MHRLQLSEIFTPFKMLGVKLNGLMQLIMIITQGLLFIHSMFVSVTSVLVGFIYTDIHYPASN